MLLDFVSHIQYYMAKVVHYFSKGNLLYYIEVLETVASIFVATSNL